MSELAKMRFHIYKDPLNLFVFLRNRTVLIIYLILFGCTSEFGDFN